MTIDQIHEAVRFRKEVSRRQLIRYLNDCDVKPLGARQRPQQYPPNSALVVLNYLGLAEAEELAPAPSTSAGNGAARGIPTLSQLRAVRKKARGK